MVLSDPLNKIKGIGDKTQKLFEKLDVNNMGELLTFYPKRYEKYTEPQRIADVTEGDDRVIIGLASNVTEPRTGGRVRLLRCIVSDGADSIELVWFNSPFVKYQLKSGYHFIFRGRVRKKGRALQMEQARIYRREDYMALMSKLQPVYSLTAGLTNNAVTKAMKAALPLAGDFPEYIPQNIRREFKIIGKHHALEEIHFPKSFETLMDARYSLVFEEFFLFQVFMRSLSTGKDREKSNVMIFDNGICDKYIEKLPYELTDDQKTVLTEIRNDLSSGNVMARLVQGDVGSGKTVLAELALLMTAKCGFQGAIMVPTEVLARQHYEGMKERLGAFGVKVALLTGSLVPSEKKKIQSALAEHRIDVVVGTHALFQDKVVFDDLALCVTDEQHRFGVKQREGLSLKGTRPHVLVMSATPIPRTLALMLYGDMDISRITTLPKNRLPIRNCVVNTGFREKAYAFIKNEVSKGHQAYVICPMVDESEEGADFCNVTDYSAMLREHYGGTVIVEKLHGKMKPQEKNDIMERFAKGEIQVLVSTTVVEVGVNVPNATVMMIENANRFGLAQLHQLRGRVGRGKDQSYCMFIYDNASEESVDRLKTLENSNDGFFIANEDLRMRGPGDLFGLRQSGELDFKIGDIFNDSEILTTAFQAAQKLRDEQLVTIIGNLKNDNANLVFNFLDFYDTI